MKQEATGIPKVFLQKSVFGQKTCMHANEVVATREYVVCVQGADGGS